MWCECVGVEFLRQMPWWQTVGALPGCSTPVWAGPAALWPPADDRADYRAPCVLVSCGDERFARCDLQLEGKTTCVFLKVLFTTVENKTHNIIKTLLEMVQKYIQSDCFWRRMADGYGLIQRKAATVSRSVRSLSCVEHVWRHVIPVLPVDQLGGVVACEPAVHALSPAVDSPAFPDHGDRAVFDFEDVGGFQVAVCRKLSEADFLVQELTCE